ALCARKQINYLESSARKQIKAPDYFRRDLYNDLAMEYKFRWGNGRIGVGVGASGGGPAVRFLEFTLRKIMKRAISAPAIKEMIGAMRIEHDENGRYPMFDELRPGVAGGRLV